MADGELVVLGMSSDCVLHGQLVVGLGLRNGRWAWIVPDGLWELARPLLPSARVQPQGGGVANIHAEAVFATIIYVLVSGCAWRAPPPCFGASKSTVHRRFVIWSRAGVWDGCIKRFSGSWTSGTWSTCPERSSTQPVSGPTKRRTHRPEPRGPG